MPLPDGISEDDVMEGSTTSQNPNPATPPEVVDQCEAQSPIEKETVRGGRHKDGCRSLKQAHQSSRGFSEDAGEATLFITETLGEQASNFRLLAHFHSESIIHSRRRPYLVATSESEKDGFSGDQLPFRNLPTVSVRLASPHS
jgi:hypothetical protein